MYVENELIVHDTIMVTAVLHNAGYLPVLIELITPQIKPKEPDQRGQKITLPCFDTKTHGGEFV